MSPIETELTTAATDLLLAGLAVFAIAVLARHRAQRPMKAGIWMAVFGLLLVASILGAAVHGLELADSTRAALWKPLNLALGLLVAFFLVGAALDTWGKGVARKLVPLAIVVGSAFFLYTELSDGSFVVFILYEAAAMIGALLLYLRLSLRGAGAWAWWMTGGVGLNIVAAAIQQTSASMRVVWMFDHNGVFHLLQAVAVLVILGGIVRSLEE